MKMVRLNIDGYQVSVPVGSTILDAAHKIGVDIPTLCHDERVAEFGACGICTVEAVGSAKLLRACATTASDGMVISTKTKRVVASRKVALELLLSDHQGDCRPPCKLACPAGTDCQGYVGLIANGEYEQSLKLIKDVLPLPASIGRVCPHPCEDACRRQLVEEPISIAQLKSFVADIDLARAESYLPEIAEDTGKRVAIVGGGPAGLSAGYYLRIAGHDVTIFDKMPKMGGMLHYGIPEYRLPKEILAKEVALIHSTGITFKNNVMLGKDVQLQDLQRDYDAVLACTGAWVSSSMRMDGEDLDGVYGGIDFLCDVILENAPDLGERVAIVGGGNTAMDACRTAVRLGAKEVYVIYRRTRDEMPAEAFEIHEAMEEGVEFLFLTNPTEFKSENGKLTGVKLQKMELGEADDSGRRRPEPTDEYMDLELDSFILAIGQGTDVVGLDSLEKTRWNTVIADESTFQTSLTGVFACGDLTNNGADIAITAMGEAEKASLVIDSYLHGETVPYKKPFFVTRDMTQQDFKNEKIRKRLELDVLAPTVRKTNFDEVAIGFTKERAKQEASRCLECGCHDFFECKLIDYANDYDVKPVRLTGREHHRYTQNTHPYIEQNVDKCILCGLCVRVCDEVMGRVALGLLDRGFETVVSPPFGVSLEKTDCVSCGQCVTLCPTGALIEKQQMSTRYVPVAETFTRSTCSVCSVGCLLDVASIGGSVTRVLPADETGLLCAGGRFGSMEAYNTKNRIVKPMIRENNALVKTDFETAYSAIRAGLKNYKPEEIGVAVSERLTLEEAYLIKKYANEVLGTENVFSLTCVESGLSSVLSVNTSTATFATLQGADHIVLVGSNVVDKALIAGMHIKKAVENGATLSIVSPLETGADEWATTKYSTNEVAFLEDAIAYLKTGKSENKLASEFAETYKGAKNAVIVYDILGTSQNAQKAAANLAIAGGHVSGAYSGILQLQSGANSQGLTLLGVKPYNGKNYKAVLSFGEILPDEMTPEFLVVSELLQTSTTAKADVLLPASAFAEASGTFVASDRKLGKVQKAVAPLAGKDTMEIVRELSQNESIARLDTESKVLIDIEKNVYGFANVATCSACKGHETYWPVHKTLDVTVLENAKSTNGGTITIPAKPTNILKRVLHQKLHG